MMSLARGDRTAFRICFIGDSFVNGTGDDENLGWVGRLCAAAATAGHDITCYNLGIRRDTSGDVLARWQQEIERRRPPEGALHLIFSFGSNDCILDHVTGKPRLSPEQSLANAAAILAAARRDYPVLMVGPLPVGDDGADRRIARLSRGLAMLCENLGTPYLEVFAAMAGCTEWRVEAAARDGAHPNAKGYAALAAVIGAWPAWQDWLRD